MLNEISLKRSLFTATTCNEMISMTWYGSWQTANMITTARTIRATGKVTVGSCQEQHYPFDVCSREGSCKFMAREGTVPATSAVGKVTVGFFQQLWPLQPSCAGGEVTAGRPGPSWRRRWVCACAEHRPSACCGWARACDRRAERWRWRWRRVARTDPARGTRTRR